MRGKDQREYRQEIKNHQEIKNRQEGSSFQEIKYRQERSSFQEKSQEIFIGSSERGQR